MATATLENVNKFSYLGLRRRPTYNEIIGLIKENETLTGPLPNRDATFFKASPEGSFFDGLDSLEVLKEEQQRILQRQLQDLMLRQTVRQNGGTYHLERHRQSTSSSSSSDTTPASLEGDRGTLSVGLLADLQPREQQMRDRQQQTGEAHRNLLSRPTTPVIDGLFSALSRQSSRIFSRTGQDTPSDVARIYEEEVPPSLRQPRPQNAETFIIGSSSESEQDLMTARSNPEELITASLRFRNPNATQRAISRATNVLVKYVNLKPEQIAVKSNNFNVLNEIYGVLNRNGFITDNVMDEYQALTQNISEERKGRKRASLLRNLAEHYTNNIFDKYMNDISDRPVPA